MHPSSSSTIASSSSPAPATPRAHNQQRQSRKSGLTAALQTQQPMPTRSSKPLQHQSQQQSQVRNGDNKNNRSQQRSSPKVTAILKRSDPKSSSLTGLDESSTTAVVQSLKTPNDSDSKQVMTQQTQPQQQRHQYQQNDQQQRFSNQRPRPQSQPQSKARRVQRRKEIESMTESLANVDLDLALNQSPPLNPSSPPSSASSSDSDDSESILSRSPLNLRQNNGGFNKGYNAQVAHLSATPLQRPSSAPVMPQSRHGIMMASPQPHHLPKVHMAATAVTGEKKGLYAGPTFHNSPAPTSLPIPAFTRSLGNSPVETPVERLPSAPFFAEAASPQLNSMRLQERSMVPQPQHDTMSWPGLHHNHHQYHSYGNNNMQMGPTHYNVPERMATSSYSPTLQQQQHIGGGRPGVDQLTEISQNLRMLLKIQSQ
ncbi:hypothetical protein BGZ83_010303 [Gryganskiella cystojenkinii]|nr:hypothetical protein BGZ83_010303 [Gryganskiella cystojenkinii]